MSGSIEIGINGMSCGSCVGRVERALASEPGVIRARVNLATAKAHVDFSGQADPDSVIRAIETAGYQPVIASAEIPVLGMSCGSCVSRVEKAISQLPGVVRSSVNLATQKTSVNFLPDVVSLVDIHQAIRQAGYEPEQVDNSSSLDVVDKEGLELRSKILFAAALTIPIVFIAMGKMLPGLDAYFAGVMSHRGWMGIEWLLTTPVLFYAGARFFRTGFAELRHFNPGMNSLVMIGSSAAYFYSVVAFLLPDLFPAGTAESYFEAAAVIVTLILLGRYFEHIAKGRTSQAIQKLLRLQAKTARVLRDGETLDVPIERVVVGDCIHVRPGDRIA
ncbi:MAG: Cu+-exporting ATPase, partial [Halopseudomonas sp.]